MSLEKAIEHGKEHRKPHGQYCPPNRFPCNGAHAGCPWCLQNRLYAAHKRRAAADQQIQEYRRS